MAVSKERALETLRQIKAPGGGDIVSRDYVRALTAQDGRIKFILEVEPEIAGEMQAVAKEAEERLKALEGVEEVSVVLTAHAPPAEKGPPPDLKVGRHPRPRQEPQKINGVDRVIAIASGKGGVGKSTVSSNLAVALARQGKRIGLLDADIYGPSQPRMMGVSQRPTSPDGKAINPLEAHGVKMMSIGLMVGEEEAVVWRGPMLMGALQQMLLQVRWGELDALLVDLPPGTGDAQLSLVQSVELAGAVIVSTPQDIALADARKAINMFGKTGAPILGMIENMSHYVCPKCGHEAEIFSRGGARRDAERLGIKFLGEIPLELSVRESSDKGAPVATKDTPVSKSFIGIAKSLSEIWGG